MFQSLSWSYARFLAQLVCNIIVVVCFFRGHVLPLPNTSSKHMNIFAVKLFSVSPSFIVDFSYLLFLAYFPSINMEIFDNTLDGLFQYATKRFDRSCAANERDASLVRNSFTAVSFIDHEIETWPSMDENQLGKLIRICQDLTFALNTINNCDYSHYDPESLRFRVLWFQTCTRIGFFDKFSGLYHLFHRKDVQRNESNDELIKIIDRTTLEGFKDLARYGIHHFNFETMLVRRALGLQRRWLMSQGLTRKESTNLTNMDSYLLPIAGPCPGHPLLDQLGTCLLDYSGMYPFSSPFSSV